MSNSFAFILWITPLGYISSTPIILSQSLLWSNWVVLLLYLVPPVRQGMLFWFELSHTFLPLLSNYFSKSSICLLEFRENKRKYRHDIKSRIVHLICVSLFSLIMTRLKGRGHDFGLVLFSLFTLPQECISNDHKKFKCQSQGLKQEAGLTILCHESNARFLFLFTQFQYIREK